MAGRKLKKMRDMHPLEWLADRIPLDWRFYAIFTVIGIVVLASLAYQVGSRNFTVLKPLYILGFLYFLEFVFKLPERISEVGGMTIEGISTILVTLAYGWLVGVIFGITLTVFGNFSTVNTPQTVVAESFSYGITAILVAAIHPIFPITAANFVPMAMFFVVTRHLYGVPLAVSMGCPAASQIPFAAANTLWSYVVLITAGGFLWGLFF